MVLFNQFSLACSLHCRQSLMRSQLWTRPALGVICIWLSRVVAALALCISIVLKLICQICLTKTHAVVQGVVLIHHEWNTWLQRVNLTLKALKLSILLLALAFGEGIVLWNRRLSWFGILCMLGSGDCISLSVVPNWCKIGKGQLGLTKVIDSLLLFLLTLLIFSFLLLLECTHVMFRRSLATESLFQVLLGPQRRVFSLLSSRCCPARLFVI